MLGKKKTANPKKHDFSALDEAVSELSKQTAALLGPSTDDKNEKPTLPKKNGQLKSRGHSFDIIQSKPSSTPSNLKTAVPKKVIVIEPEQELLPEHASLSFNEAKVAPAELPERSDDKQAPSDNSIAITTHKVGLINTMPEVTEPVEVLPQAEASKKPPEDEPKELANPVIPEPNQDTPESQLESSKGSLSFENEDKSEEKDTVTPEKPVLSPEKATDKPAETKEKTEEDHQPSTPPAGESQSYESTGLYANNLVKNKSPKGYEPLDSQQLPTVFDTNEYHEELHDWSKLGGGGGAKIVLLLLLLIVAGGAAYFVISGQQLPF